MSRVLRHFSTIAAIVAIPPALSACGGSASTAMPNAAPQQLQNLQRTDSPSATRIFDTSDVVPLVKVAAPFVKVPQPAGAGCVAAKINNANNLYYGVFNCNNNLAYDAEGVAKPPAIPPVILLNPPPPPPGAGAFVAEKAFDVDQLGNAVGFASFIVGGVATAFPAEWNKAGAGLVILNLPAEAIGIEEFGTPGPVGQQSPPNQAFWFAPPANGPIAPGGISQANDVNAASVVVGQLAGTAALGPGHFGPLAPIPGIAPRSTALAINNPGEIVGDESTGAGGSCGPNGFAGDGFTYTAPKIKRYIPVAPFCVLDWLDLNETGSIVGYKTQAVGGANAAFSALAMFKNPAGAALCAPFAPNVVTNLNTGVLGSTWKHLTDADGVDDACDVIATDRGAAGPGQVYIIN